MYDVASTVIAQKISQVDGVGKVSVGGQLAARGARRRWTSPALTRAASRSEDVRTAITAANVNRPKGVIEDGGPLLAVVAIDQLSKADEYQNADRRATTNGSAVRLGDWAK